MRFQPQFGGLSPKRYRWNICLKCGQQTSLAPYIYIYIYISLSLSPSLPPPTSLSIYPESLSLSLALPLALSLSLSLSISPPLPLPPSLSHLSLALLFSSYLPLCVSALCAPPTSDCCFGPQAYDTSLSAARDSCPIGTPLQWPISQEWPEQKLRTTTKVNTWAEAPEHDGISVAQGNSN